jgi:hypothetical protein
MKLSQFEEAVGHRRGADPGPNEAWHHGSEIVAPVEAVFELGEVAWYMLAADGAVGSDDRRLDVAQCRIDPFEGWRARRLWPRAGFDDLMRAAGIGHAGEAPKPVADHRAVGIETAFGEPRDRMAAKAGDPAQLQANRLAVLGGFDRGDERRLARRAASPLAAGALAAEVGVIDLDAPGESLAGVAFEHDLRKLMLDFPGGGLGYAEAAAEFDAGDALLALSQMIDRPEPQPQRQLGRSKDRPRDRRGLQAAGAALKQIAGCHHAVLFAATGRTFETVRPSRRNDRGPALVLGAVASLEFRFAEPLLELHRVTRHRHTPRNQRMFMVCTILRPAEQDA